MKRISGNDLGGPSVKSCEDCAAKCFGGFRKVAALHGSGVAIYQHRQPVSEQCDKLSQTRESSRNPDTFIVYNTSNNEISKNIMVGEMSTYKTKCVTCKGIIKRVRTLLEEVKSIRGNEVYAICDHCTRTGVKCKRCEYILKKFEETKTEERDQLFRQWLCKVKQLLETISKGNICQYRLNQETSDAAELDNLLMELNSPMLAQRQLEIGAFPPMKFQENLAHSKDMLQELIEKLKYESGMKKYSSNESLFVPGSQTGCVCKYLMDRKLEQHKDFEALTRQETEPPKLTRASSKTDLVSKLEQKKEGLQKDHRLKEKDKLKKRSSTTVVEQREEGIQKDNRLKEKDKLKKGSSTTEGSVKEKSTKTRKGTVTTERSATERSIKARKGSLTTDRSVTEKSTKAKKGSSTEKSSVTDKENKSSTEKKPKKTVQSEESKLFKKLLAERAKNREKKEKEKRPKETKTKLPSFGELPKIRHLKKREVVEEVSESILECDEGIMRSPKEMITHKKIVPFHEHNEVINTESIQPLLYKREVDCQASEAPPNTTQSYTTSVRKKIEISDRSGSIRYRLSDRQFIEKGWTQLPSTKILRRMNIYKMLPVSSNDWFARHRNLGTMLYESGEKLAMIEEDGQGKWFYKNGTVALEYYNAEEMLVQKRCVVYSYEACAKKSKSQTVLACFDYLGNGVVYDSRGNERLKYNQSEGHLIDEKIGPPGFWKWHTLNDPPVFHKAFIETYSEDQSAFPNVTDEDNEKSLRNEGNDAMLAIEFENFVKEKADKLLQKFKPFQIRMKTVKINDYFSVRVMDQANIYLLFRDGAVSLKLNLGMLLQSKEIIDSDSVELNSVGTPYDRRPARSESVRRLQDILLSAKGEK